MKHCRSADISLQWALKSNEFLWQREKSKESRGTTALSSTSCLRVLYESGYDSCYLLIFPYPPFKYVAARCIIVPECRAIYPCISQFVSLSVRPTQMCDVRVHLLNRWHRFSILRDFFLLSLQSRVKYCTLFSTTFMWRLQLKGTLQIQNWHWS